MTALPMSREQIGNKKIDSARQCDTTIPRGKGGSHRKEKRNNDSPIVPARLCITAHPYEAGNCFQNPLPRANGGREMEAKVRDYSWCFRPEGRSGRIRAANPG